jgi:phage gp36-like protein
MYTDVDAIKKALPFDTLIELTDDNGNDEVDVNNVEWAVDAAKATIDAYNNGIHPIDIPVDDVPPFIKLMATNIAIWHLYKRKLRLTIPDSLQKCYDDAIKFLEKGQKGEIAPFPDPQPQRAKVTTRKRTFTSSVLNCYKGS